MRSAGSAAAARGAGVPLPGANRRQSGRLDRRRAGRPVDLLRGRRVGRRLEDDRRRHPVGPDLRQHAGRRDRRAGGQRRPIRRIVWAGTGEAWAIRDSDVIGDGDLQVDRRRQDVDAHGARRDGPHRPHHRAPVQPRHRVRLRDRPHHRPAAGARRLPDDRRRPALGPRALRRREHRLLRAVDGRRRTRVRSSPARGRWRCTRGPSSSGGPGSGVYVSHDGGTKWTSIEGHGLPHSPVGKIDVAIAPTDSNRVYALIQTADQGSDVAIRRRRRRTGASSTGRAQLIGRAGYYIRLAVSPANEDEVLVSDSSFFQSTRRRR